MPPISVVSREVKLKIVGVADLDPESMRGPTRARVFIPLNLAESLHVMQPTDLREVSRAAGNQPSYSSVNVRVKNPGQIRDVEAVVKKMGFNNLLHSRRNPQSAAIFCGARRVPGNLRQPRPRRRFHRNRKHTRDGHPGSAVARLES